MLDIPELPDRARMYRECGARIRDSMRDKGVDALVLLGNGNVVYATGASWPLLDAGLSHVERPVAVVRKGRESWLVSARGRVITRIARGADGGLARVWVAKATELAPGDLLTDADGGSPARALAFADALCSADGDISFA